MIYLIAAEGRPLIKIGYTARQDIEKRLAELQTGCPDRLQVLAVLPGDRHLEAWLHKSFASQRGRGEWFRASAEEVSRAARQYPYQDLNRHCPEHGDVPPDDLWIDKDGYTIATYLCPQHPDITWEAEYSPDWLEIRAGMSIGGPTYADY